ncbi:MAG: hypothetical protein KGM49_14090 [Sphingomonadales bacterium]|nr:hypothetical protein [Sphingomonadales bacterium]
MATANTTEQGRATRADDDRFYVTATKPIQLRSRLIGPGVHLLIDPKKRARDGSMVLRGSLVEPWSGSADYQGVVVATLEED